MAPPFIQTTLGLGCFCTTGDGKNLYRLRKDELTIYTFLGNVADHAISSKELCELLERTSTAISDVVVAVITKGNLSSRAERRSVDIIAQELIRLTCHKRRLPHIGAIVVLELADGSDGLIVHDKLCVLTVRTLQCIHKLNYVISSKRSSGNGCSATTGCGKKAQRLSRTGTVQEGILLGISKGLAEHVDDIALQVEGIIIKKLLGYLDGNMQLMGIQQNLVEGCITEAKCATLLDPSGSRLCCSNVDLVLTGCSNLVTKLTHDVLLSKDINQAMVVLIRYQITTICVHTFLQYVRDLLEVRTKGSEHSSLIGIGCTSSLCVRRSGRGRLRSKWSIYRLRKLGIQCLLALQTSDFLAKVCDILFHPGIGCIVLSSEGTLLGTMRIQKCLSSIPCVVTLFAKFINRHSSITSIKCVV
nr:MAG TPA: hypothetical protein [Caudoviricetes sp.]